MKRTRILKEQKFFKIYTPDEHICGHGFNDYISSKTYYDEPFISEEDCNMKLQLAQKQQKEEKSVWKTEEPKLKIYWKVLEETIQTENES